MNSIKEVIIMNSKLFAIKIPENEKIAMDYVANVTNNTLSKLFYKPIQDAIATNLGLILLYKIDLRNSTKLSDLHEDLMSYKSLQNRSLPIIEDFVSLMLDKSIKKSFWSIFSNIELNEKEFLLYDLNLAEIANYLGREYISHHGDFEEIDLNLARNIFFNYMLMTYFNITALGSINKLNNDWNNRQPLVKQFQSQLISRYLNRFQPKKVEAIKLDEIMEVSEYIE